MDDLAAFQLRRGARLLCSQLTALKLAVDYVWYYHLMLGPSSINNGELFFYRAFLRVRDASKWTVSLITLTVNQLWKVYDFSNFSTGCVVGSGHRIG